MLENITAAILAAFEIRQAILETSCCLLGLGFFFKKKKKATVAKTIVGSNKCKESLQFSGRVLVILLTNCKDFLNKIGVINYNHLIFNKITKEKSIEEKGIFNKQCWEIGQLHVRQQN